MSRRTAAIIVTVAAIALVVGIAVFWSREEGGSTNAFCTSVRSGENPLDAFNRYDPSNADTAQLTRGVDRLRQLQRAAPDQIKSDMAVLVDVAQQLVQALDAAARHQAVPDLSSQSERARAASLEVTQFAAGSCGVTLDSGSAGPPPTAAASG